MDNKSILLMQRYELGRLLGQGTFGKVYYGRSIQTGQSVAIKVIDKEKITRARIIDQIKREISVMRLVRHPNVIHLYEVMATKTKIYFVMEYAKGGELFNKVAKGKLKEDVARKYFQQLISAVDFCHSTGVYHRDLKPENILLDESENLKVTDFGLSAIAESKHEDGLFHTTCGTPAYVAPEVINQKGYDGVKADIWSCGVILFVLLAGYLPFYNSNLMEMYRKIEKAEYKFPSWFSLEACRLLTRILDPNPNSRISIDRIKESSWFRRGLHTKAKANDPETSASSSSDGEAALRLSYLNAFHIVSLSGKFDLSRLFEDSRMKRESTRFISSKPASVIISQLEEVAKRMKMKITKKDGGLFKLEGLKEGRKGILSFDAEIFVLTPAMHLVEFKKTNGDTLEYEKMLDEGIRPGLEDIGCTSGRNEPPPQQRCQQLDQQDNLPEPPLLPDLQQQRSKQQLDPTQQQALTQERLP